MAYGVRVEVWGDYAAFNRPEMKVERVSYEVMTPSAARGILEAIYWKPQMRWVIDCIRVLAPIRFTHIRRNEIDTVIPARNIEEARKSDSVLPGILVEDVRQQRAAMIVRDVRYGIEAHVAIRAQAPGHDQALEHPAAKHLETFKRRVGKGQYFHHPYLGCREFPANVRLLSDDEQFPPPPPELAGDRELGFMLWDILFVPNHRGTIVESSSGRRVRAVPRFFRASMTAGVVRVPPLDSTGGEQ